MQWPSVYNGVSLPWRPLTNQRIEREVQAMRRLLKEMPVDVADAEGVPQPEQEGRLRQELAVRLYQKRLLPFGKARELAGMSKWAFHMLLGAEGVTRTYDSEELAEDLSTLEMLPLEQQNRDR
jgi:Uncharacterised protein family (UPF0175).